MGIDIGEYVLPLVALYFSNQIPHDDDFVILLIRAGIGAIALGWGIGSFLIGKTAVRKCDKTVFSYFKPKKDKKGKPIPDSERDIDEAVITSVMEYDLAQLKATAIKNALSLLVLALLHWAFKAITPLIVALLMAPYRFANDPLVNIHLFGRPAMGDLARPFDNNKQSAATLVGEIRKEWAELQALKAQAGAAPAASQSKKPVKR